jgi:hypothetical protein
VQVASVIAARDIGYQTILPRAHLPLMTLCFNLIKPHAQAFQEIH